VALSIKTAEADRLARELSRLTGETMTEAVTKSLAERLARIRQSRGTKRSSPDRLRALAKRIAKNYDVRPVTKEEWDRASGDTG